METRRVVITGMGVVSPLGNTPDAAWESAKNGVSGISLIENFDASVLATSIAGEVKDFDPTVRLGKRDARRTDRYAQFAMAAAMDAMEHAGLEITDENRWRAGVVLGTGIGPVASLSTVFDQFRDGGHRNVKPLSVLQTLSESPASRISIEFGMMGPTYAVISACAAGNNAMGEAADLIRLGRADVIISGGSESALIPMCVAGFNNMKTLMQNEEPVEAASRPFDVDRGGFVIAEGCGMFVMESLEHARARGATILAEFSGYGNTSDAFHVTAPKDDGLGAAKAMELALEDAQLNTDDIDYINAHGTSTPLNDPAETLAIKRAFGERAYNIPISSTKSMTGHALGGTPGVEAVLCIQALQENLVPPTINLDNPDPACDLDYVPHTAREVELNHVISNAFGFGGHNAVIVLSRFDG